VAATKIKVIELAKELGVTSKDLMVAAEEMGHKGVRAMTPLDQKLANELRVKLGKGRELPEEPKPKRAGKPRAMGDGAPKPAVRARKTATEEGGEDAEVRPAATIVKPKPAVPAEIAPEPPVIAAKPADIAPEPPRVAPPAPVIPPPPAEPMKPAAAAPPAAPPVPPTPAPTVPPAVPPTVRRPDPKIVPFRPLEASRRGRRGRPRRRPRRARPSPRPRRPPPSVRRRGPRRPHQRRRRLRRRRSRSRVPRPRRSSSPRRLHRRRSR
jgi:translation initiation factor IF-2